ncbi:conjugal transfer protein TraL [Neisseria sp. Ec49-e6-T10]|uniref:conjugal transfer protein TraL n=1 Tax=Neisseria sp. Ec49-e6-T10 TaxID=3140744 RepID=UPI003EBEF9A6
MKEVHLITQGKGGVGKSLVASFIAQYLRATNQDTPVHCFDTDPVNPTFSRYKALDVSVVNILNNNNNIDSRNFDGLIEQLVEAEGIAVVDNGAATFVPLMSYMAENSVDALLADSEVELYIHSVIAGGQAQKDCLDGLFKTVKGIQAHVVVWLNHHFGQIEESGKSFSEFKFVKDHRDKIIKTVELHPRNPDTFGKDIQKMTSLNLTFDEIANHPDFTMMPRQRLKQVRNDIWGQLGQDELFSRAGNQE